MGIPRNMKVLGFLLAKALTYEPRTYKKEDCPSVVFPANKRWVWIEDEFGFQEPRCEALDVEVTCSSNSMTVKFHADHIYAALDESHIDQATSAAFVGTCESKLTQSTLGFYEVTFGLDDCGTKVIQERRNTTDFDEGSAPLGGAIAFINTIQGSSSGLRTDGIISTSPLKLEVACVYSDQLVVDTSDLDIRQHQYQLAEEIEQGKFDAEFKLASYSDPYGTIPINATNPVTIGQPVYNQLTVSDTFSQRLVYSINTCIAYSDETFDLEKPHYTIIKDGCFSKLIALDGIQYRELLVGNHATPAGFGFNGFTFDSTDDKLFLKCNIDICAILQDEYDNRSLTPGCGYQLSTCSNGEPEFLAAPSIADMMSGKHQTYDKHTTTSIKPTNHIAWTIGI